MWASKTCWQEMPRLLCSFLKDPWIKVNRELDFWKSRLRKRIHLDFSFKNIFIRKANRVVKKNCVLNDLEVSGIKSPALDSLGVPVCVCICVCVHVYTWVCACVCVYMCVYMCTLECVPVCVCMWVCIHVYTWVSSPRSHVRCVQVAPWSGLCSYEERGPGWGTSSPHTLWLEAHVGIIGWVQLTPFCKNPHNHCNWIMCLCVSL